MRSRRAAMLGLLGVGVACARPPGNLPVEVGVTFALHAEGETFVVDRMGGGATGIVAPARWILTPSPPSLVLQSDDEVRAALWLVGRSRIIVRGEPSTIAPRTGEVLSSWDGGVFSLALWTRDGTPFRTDPFRHEGEAVGLAILSRDVSMSSGPRGTYRTALRDAEGAVVGWMRARIGPERAARAYDAVLPPSVDDGLAAAATVALDAEVGWLADHAAGARGSEQEERGRHEAE